MSRSLRQVSTDSLRYLLKSWVFMLIDSQPTHLNAYISHLKIRAEVLYSSSNAVITRIETTPASPAPAWTLRFFRKGAFFPSIYLGFQICNLGLFYSVSVAVIIRIETFHWILDISSRWAEVQYFFAPIKRKHGWQLGRTRLEFRAKNHVVAAIFK